MNYLKHKDHYKNYDTHKEQQKEEHLRRAVQYKMMVGGEAALPRRLTVTSVLRLHWQHGHARFQRNISALVNGDDGGSTFEHKKKRIERVKVEVWVGGGVRPQFFRTESYTWYTYWDTSGARHFRDSWGTQRGRGKTGWTFAYASTAFPLLHHHPPNRNSSLSGQLTEALQAGHGNSIFRV